MKEIRVENRAQNIKVVVQNLEKRMIRDQKPQSDEYFSILTYI